MLMVIYTLLLIVYVGVYLLLGVGLFGHGLTISILVPQDEMVGSQVVLLLIIQFGILERQMSRVVSLERGLVVVYCYVICVCVYWCGLPSRNDWLGH